MQSVDFVSICMSDQHRNALAVITEEKLRDELFTLMTPLRPWIIDDAESGSSLHHKGQRNKEPNFSMLQD